MSSKQDYLDAILEKNNGVIQSSDAVSAGISKVYFSEYVKKKQLERVSRGVYLSGEAWADPLYFLQLRYPQVVFSHETALYLLDLAEREPLQFTVTVKAGYNATHLRKQNIKVYQINAERYDMGIIQIPSPVGHQLNIYNAERTICDLIRSRKNIEIQDLQAAVKSYIGSGEKNLPLLMRYAKVFRTEKILRQYLEVLL